MRIYISGPITGNPNARRDFGRAERELRWEGHDDIVNPEALLRGLRMTHDEYLHVCQSFLEVSDVMILLPGWRDSKGACLEIGIALANKIRIFEIRANNRLKPFSM